MCLFLGLPQTLPVYILKDLCVSFKASKSIKYTASFVNIENENFIQDYFNNSNFLMDSEFYNYKSKKFN